MKTLNIVQTQNYDLDHWKMSTYHKKSVLVLLVATTSIKRMFSAIKFVKANQENRWEMIDWTAILSYIPPPFWVLDPSLIGSSNEFFPTLVQIVWSLFSLFTTQQVFSAQSIILVLLLPSSITLNGSCGTLECTCSSVQTPWGPWVWGDE